MNETSPASPEEDRRKKRDVETYFNALFSEEPLELEPGQAIWSESKDHMIVATVGTGIAVAVHDRDLNLGAVGYVLVPQDVLKSFPDFSKIDSQLIDDLLKPLKDCIEKIKGKEGSARQRVHVRLLGGANLLGDDQDLGTKRFYQRYAV